MKPLSDALFSPGILYNTVKSGMAVDYPIVTDPLKFSNVDLAVSGGVYSSGSWVTTFNSIYTLMAQNVDDYQNNYRFFDQRLPFETMLEPEKHLVGKSFVV
jgi:hypothetical protein